jgi:hypothetical protein
VNELIALPGVQALTGRDGLTSLRFRGLEVARMEHGNLLVGLDRTEAVPACGPAAVRALIDGLARMRSPDAADRGNPLFTRAPEAWLEAQVRASLAVISADLRPDPVYGQVPSFSGGERGIVDLLASDGAGRLTVIELKATADPHLPLQALDYWLRVHHHALSGDFPARGYFPGVPVSRQPPRLLLVAPALEFHTTTEAVLRFFSPEIDVERVGIGRDWRRRITVSFRARGAESPGLPAPVTG